MALLILVARLLLSLRRATKRGPGDEDGPYCPFAIVCPRLLGALTDLNYPKPQLYNFSFLFYLMKISVSKWNCLLTNIPYEVLRSLSGVNKMLAVIVMRVCTLRSL